MTTYITACDSMGASYTLFSPDDGDTFFVNVEHDIPEMINPEYFKLGCTKFDTLEDAEAKFNAETGKNNDIIHRKYYRAYADYYGYGYHNSKLY